MNKITDCKCGLCKRELSGMNSASDLLITRQTLGEVNVTGDLYLVGERKNMIYNICDGCMDRILVLINTIEIEADEYGKS